MTTPKITKLPIGEIDNHTRMFYIFTTLKPGWAEAFIERNLKEYSSHGLESQYVPPARLKSCFYHSLSFQDDWVQKEFGFDPKTHMQIDGSHENREEPEITREGIERFMKLCEKEGAKTLFITDSTGATGVCYCSDNLLEKVAQKAK